VKQKSTGHVCEYTLAGQRCMDRHRYAPYTIPALDHPSVWTKDGKLHTIVSQPYHLRYEDMKQTVAMCELLGLEADVDAWDSWHFPGATLLITYRQHARRHAVTPLDLARMTPEGTIQ
jgi:hypothetical protein